MLAAVQSENQTPLSTKQQWVQASGPEKDRSVSSLLASSWGDVYAASSGSVYGLTPGASTRTLVSPLMQAGYSDASGEYHNTAMAERNDTLYLVFADALFASKDRGETWSKLGERPSGRVIGLVVPDHHSTLPFEMRAFSDQQMPVNCGLPSTIKKQG